MGANVDAANLLIGSPPDSWGALHADNPARAPRCDNPALIRDDRSRIGCVDLRVHLKQVGPALLTKVNAEDLPFGPAVTVGTMCEPPQGISAIPPVLHRLD
jgi:hypothetical protein